MNWCHRLNKTCTEAHPLLCYFRKGQEEFLKEKKKKKKKS